jgi:hypothetical protein
MEQVRKSVGDVPFFGAAFPHDKVFGKDNPQGVPVILKLKPSDRVHVEMMGLATEFLDRVDKPSDKRRAVA